MWYNIDFDTNATNLLPTVLRMPKMVSFLNSLVLPIKNLYAQWFYFRSDNLNKISYNGQVFLLQKLLNDSFDIIGRRIVIVDATDANADFVIRVPKEAFGLQNRVGMRRMVDNYKIAGMRFNLEKIV